ncbi:V-type ATP synthase subunit F [Paludicola sp. MB14-C6]|uniref:V-type ATP synthase subunit F n=1 Tax=Paludihabitans sp. MB14-C6 TaxID=3070656 RepID=UPI0027DD6D61|nr:V-type ATP synthase subunit F [Paludicola sp. MB14-C6]WMJ22610.1 V-type ATP synthase subunit F [Paludicola sp. MB14-C6]
MKFYVISDNIDTCIGMRMSGIEGIVAHEEQEVQDALKDAFSNSEIGIVLMTKKLIDLCHDTVFQYKLNNKRPLIVEIPDRHATSKISDTISRYISEAVGIHI